MYTVPLALPSWAPSVRFTLPDLFPRVIDPLVATQPLSPPLWSTKDAVERLNFFAAAPGFASVMVIAQFLNFLDDNVVENELSWAPLVLPLQLLTGPSFNVPDKAPVTTNELVGDADALSDGTTVETNANTISDAAPNTTRDATWVGCRFPLLRKLVMCSSLS
jgi:hypothetical protein